MKIDDDDESCCYRHFLMIEKEQSLSKGSLMTPRIDNGQRWPNDTRVDDLDKCDAARWLIILRNE